MVHRVAVGHDIAGPDTTASTPPVEIPTGEVFNIRGMDGPEVPPTVPRSVRTL